MDEKRCSGCGQVLPVSAFYARKPRWPNESPYSSRCKECAKAWSREQYETVWKHDPEHIEKQRQTAVAHYQRNKEKISARRKERREENRAWAVEWRQKLRDRCLDAYGGKCECCGEDRREFLAFDHIDGGGNQHRKKLGGYFLRWLVNHDFPKTIRILCHNCNSALAFYGYCPHQGSANAQESRVDSESLPLS